METTQSAAASVSAAAQSATPEATPCFLCAYGSPCQTPMIEGELLRVIERATSDRLPAILITTADGERVGVLLNEYARSLAKALCSLPPQRWRGLHLRLYHLLPLTIRPSSAADVMPDTAPVADAADAADVADCAATPTLPNVDDVTESHASRWLRATPISAIVLEPDLLLNITDINNAEYCVRQYPLRRMVPSAPTLATVRGIAIHQAFKELLKSGRHAPEELAAHRDLALRNQAVDL
ncbi:MAG: hypothetical protein ABI068_15895, partial [Ktedonobacterales bacterium]